MKIMNKLVIVALIIGSFLAPAQAEVDEKTKKQLLSLLSEVITATPTLVEESPVPGLYTVLYGTQLFFVSKDGRYAFEKPQMIDLKTRDDVADKIVSTVRQSMLAALDDKTMVTYPPTDGKEVKHTITVFTDIDCPYCQKLHDERKQLLDEGVKIRYLMYPRAGVDSESFKTAEAVFCAKDQQKAMTDAKAIAAYNAKISRSGEANPKYKHQVSSPKCESPVKEHMSLLHALGMEVATPQILLESGDLIRGYIPAQELLKVLAKTKG